MSKFIKITDRDNVAVAIEKLQAGEEILGVKLLEDVPAGHKFALCDIAEGENVVKYAFPIGHATKAIAAGSWVHTHNVKTNLSGLLEYTYNPHPCAVTVDRAATARTTTARTTTAPPAPTKGTATRPATAR